MMLDRETSAMRLKQAMDLRKFKQVDLCNATGIPKSAISQYVHGKFEPKHGRLSKIAKALDVNEAWLLGYDVPIERESNYPPLIKNAIPIGKMGRRPVIGQVSAGNETYANDDILWYENVDEKYDNDDYFYFQVVGDSMSPKIENNDLVLVHVQPSVDSGNYAVVVVDDEDGCVKRVKYGQNWIELHSINPYYPVRKFKGNEVMRIRVVGKVIEIKRKL